MRRSWPWLEARGAVARMVVAVAAGALAGIAGWLLGGWPWGLLWALATQSVWFSVANWLALWPADADRTMEHARRDEFRPVQEEIVIVALLAAGIAATPLLGRVAPGSRRSGAALLALAVVFMQWFGLHAMYAARYAYEYYLAGPGGDRDPAGIDFNQSEPPAYRDFLYFSYNLGMTYQVSDTAVTNSRIRAVVLRHCLVSYAFALVILASTVNVVTGVLAAGL
ncbi:DUF1345 domain-containing protein [Acidipropionibacterium jensenii]|uniref:DUF1345 domain-containing protein n=1 Tax=Acidipropionibacterium jensenii TaxID=1749 RepID=UPI00214AC112|nr:DUF1345 domain-containing protein [Acidipropionibacterium jensenii]